MKKKVWVIGLVLSTFLFVSCKKDFTCTCTHNEDTYTYSIQNSKTKEAKSKCNRLGIQWINLGGTCGIDKNE